MTTPFLPIFSNAPSVVAGTSDAGNKGPAIGETTSQDGGNVAFSDVLGKTQQVLPQSSENPKDLLGDQNIFSAAVFQNQELLNTLTSQQLTEEELNENLTSLLYEPGPVETAALNLPTSHEVLAQSSSLSVERQRQAQGVGQSVLERQVISADSQRLPNQFQTLPPSVRQGNSNISGGIVSEIPAHNRLTPTLSILDRLSGELGVVTQAVSGQGVRVQPLINESPQPILATPPSSVPVSAPLTDSEVNVQRLLSALEGSGNNPRTEAGVSSVSSVLPLSREENFLSLSRVEGEGKTVGALSSSQSGEAGFGTHGSGLPFGNHAGSGHGQLLDSSSGSVLSPSQGQVVSKGGSFDDRLQLLNTSVPQRLQIDVQLSEAARVQVDVGVQQRQVYAGVLLDNPMLRALASQNVQDLENQLSQAEMELEEFGVHGEDEQLSEQAASDDFNRDSLQTRISDERESSSTPHTQEHSRERSQQDTGWHLVA